MTRMSITRPTKGYEGLIQSIEWYLRHGLQQDAEYAILVVRPVEQQDRVTMPAAFPIHSSPPHLTQLATRLRTLIRRTDHIEVAEGRGVAIILHGADTDGARATFRRLRAALSGPTDTEDSPYTLAIGYATTISGTARRHVTVERILRAAWRPRIFVTISSASVAEEMAPAYGAETLAALRSIPITSGVSSANGHEIATRALTSSSATAPALFTMPTAGRAALQLVAEEPSTEEDRETLRAQAYQIGVPFVQLPKRIPPSCSQALPPELAHELRAVAIGRARSSLTVAMENPRDTAAVMRLRAVTGLSIFPVLADPRELAQALRRMTKYHPVSS